MSRQDFLWDGPADPRLNRSQLRTPKTVGRRAWLVIGASVHLDSSARAAADLRQP
ncbi:hypothetical protein ACFQ2B_38520 [Streptomyces stramineus]